jgi:hypothetical protein
MLQGAQYVSLQMCFLAFKFSLVIYFSSNPTDKKKFKLGWQKKVRDY